MDKHSCASIRDGKPKVSDLRKRFAFIKASFAVEDIYFTKDEERIFEGSISRRHRGPGFEAAGKRILQNADVK